MTFGRTPISCDEALRYDAMPNREKTRIVLDRMIVMLIVLFIAEVVMVCLYFLGWLH